jgi:hypothetical protein
MAGTFSYLLAGFLAWIVWLLKQCWDQVFQEEDPEAWRPYALWVAKGLVGPILLWMVLGGGLLPGTTPLIPELTGGRGRPGYLAAVFLASGPFALVAASLWVAVSAGWLLILARPGVRDRSDYNSAAGFWLAVLAVPAWCLWNVGGLYGLGFALAAWLMPACWATCFLPRHTPAPANYSAAIARTKFGRYEDAEQAVIRELEHHSEDYDGWLMLAELYATKFNDLPESDRTVRQLCTQPGLNAIQVSLALNRLADWHLKLGQDPVAARAALSEIPRLIPDTHEARMAVQRINQLPRSREELIEHLTPRRVVLPALADVQGPSDAGPALSPVEARKRADRCVERLRDDPNLVEAREEFARLLAGPLAKPRAAIEQVELLLGMPDAPELRRAEWLALLAAWQERELQDPAATKQALRRIVNEAPQTPQAFAAQRKLSLIEVEEAISARRKAAADAPPRLKVR